MGLRPRTVALLLLLLSSPAAARTVALVPLPVPARDEASTLLILRLLEQETRRLRPADRMVRGSEGALASCGDAAAITADTADCWRQALVRLKADELLAGSVAGEQGSYRLTILRLEATGAPTADALTLNVSADGLALVSRFFVQRFLERGELQPAGQADLLLWPDPPESEVLLGGSVLGRGRVFLRGLPPGEVEVRVRAPVHLDRIVRRKLAAGEVAEERLLLEPGVQGLPEPGRLTSLGLGATALFAAGGLAFGLLEHRTQQEYDDTPLRQDRLDDLQALADRGERYALGANVSLGMAAATLVGSGVLYWLLDWRGAQHDAQELREARAKKEAARLGSSAATADRSEPDAARQDAQQVEVVTPAPAAGVAP